MAGLLRATKAGAERVRRVILADERQALARLQVRQPPGDEAVHDARKSLKEARAGLRLVRDALGVETFRRENEILRDAARPLSEVRDAKVLIESFDRVLRSERKKTDRDRWAALRESLIEHQASVRRRVLRGSRKPESLLSALQTARQHAKTWNLGDGAALPAGMRRVYRAGRRAFDAARLDPSVDNLHEWRKQTKYLWNQLRILDTGGSRVTRQLRQRSHRLSDLLGSDHDLAILRQYLRTAAFRRHRTKVQALSLRIDRRREQLQAQAVALGARVYAKTPRAFVRDAAA